MARMIRFSTSFQSPSLFHSIKIQLFQKLLQAAHTLKDLAGLLTLALDHWTTGASKNPKGLLRQSRLLAAGHLFQ